MRRGRNALSRGAGYQERRNALAEAERAMEDNRIRAWVYDTLGEFLPPASANALAGAVDFVPFVGDVSGGEDAFQAFRRGDLIGGGVALGATALGLVPGVGDFASKAVRSAADGAGGAARKGIRAFHGSPHDFDRFDMSRIGTGEGAQAYGHGLYFAEKEGVARSYRDALSGFRPTERMPDKFYAKDLDKLSLDSDSMKLLTDYFEQIGDLDDPGTWDDFTNIESVLQQGLGYDAVEKLRSNVIKAGFAEINPGRMYEVRINADPEDFLDWDKPLSEQPEAIRRRLGWTAEAEAQFNAARQADDDALLAALTGDADYTPANLRPPDGVPPLTATGADIVKGNSVFDRASDAPTAQRLRDAGIPGIRYLDQGSRAAGEGSRNYVVFDDSLVEILRKYGIGGLIAGGGAYGLTQQELEQAQREGIF